MQIHSPSQRQQEKTSGKQQQAQATKHMGMAAELADILSQLDDAAKLADELEFDVGSRR